MRVSATGVLIVIVLAFVTGCKIGPKWHGNVQLPPLLEAPGDRTVIVSEFLKSVTNVSITGSAQLQAIRESVRVRDVSVQLVQELRKRGIKAEARSGFHRKDLKEDQILLSGAMLAGPWASGKNITNALIFIPTLMIIGGVLPTPLGCETGVEIHYNVEIEGADGRILMQSPDANLIGYYRDHYIWPLAGRSKEAGVEMMGLMPDKIAAALAERLDARSR